MSATTEMSDTRDEQANPAEVGETTSDKGFDPRRLARVILPKRGEPRDVRSLYIVENESTPGRVTALDRTSAHIPAGTEVSFETYFNGFPASYWRR